MPIHDEGGGIDYFGDGILSSPQAVRRAAKKAEETRQAKKSPTMINREKIVALIHAFCEGDVEKQDQLLSEELNFRTSLRQGVDFKENIMVDKKPLFLSEGEELNIWRALDRLDAVDALAKLLPYYKSDMVLRDPHGEHHNLPIHLIRSGKSEVLYKLCKENTEFSKEYAYEIFTELLPSKHSEKKRNGPKIRDVDLVILLLKNHQQEISEKTSISQRLLQSSLQDRRIYETYANTYPEVFMDVTHKDFLPMEKLFKTWHMSVNTIEVFFDRCDVARQALNIKDSKGETVLFRLAMMKHRGGLEKDYMPERTDIADFLIASGASALVTDKRDWTILDRLSQYEENNSPMAKLLIASGAGYHKQISAAFMGYAQARRVKPQKLSLSTIVQKKTSGPKK